MRTTALLAAAIGAVGCAHHRAEASPAPDYREALASFKAAGPVTFEPGSLYEGPVLATFFATWCFPCLGQLPYFAELQKEYSDRGLRVVAVGMDLDGRKVLDPFAAQYALPYPVLVGDDALRAGKTPFGLVRELPTTVVLARDGSVVAAWAGLARAEDVREQVEKAFQR